MIGLDGCHRLVTRKKRIHPAVVQWWCLAASTHSAGAELGLKVAGEALGKTHAIGPLRPAGLVRGDFGKQLRRQEASCGTAGSLVGCSDGCGELEEERRLRSRTKTARRLVWPEAALVQFPLLRRIQVLPGGL